MTKRSVRVAIQAAACTLPLLSCGTAASRNLQSITLNPALGLGPSVQFTATDHWSTSPVDTAPLTPMWGVCNDGNATTDISVSRTGVATCGQGAHGTYQVFVVDPTADTGPVCNLRDACGRGCQITGQSQISCH